MMGTIETIFLAALASALFSWGGIWISENRRLKAEKELYSLKVTVEIKHQYFRGILGKSQRVIRAVESMQEEYYSVLPKIIAMENPNLPIEERKRVNSKLIEEMTNAKRDYDRYLEIARPFISHSIYEIGLKMLDVYNIGYWSDLPVRIPSDRDTIYRLEWHNRYYEAQQNLADAITEIFHQSLYRKSSKQKQKSRKEVRKNSSQETDIEVRDAE